MKKINIAIDGHSSCGKSTMAKNLAKSTSYHYIDSGAMYRAVTLYCLNEGLLSEETIQLALLEKLLSHIHIDFIKNKITGEPETYLNGKNVEKEIRSMEVANHVSSVSTIDFVRKAMVSQQQEMGKNKGIIMDGRDIGTVVFPDAELKVFVTARPEIRAKRRYDELIAKGTQIALEEVLQNVEKRDRIDSTRKVSPLKIAEDAIILDNSDMTLEEQQEWLFNQFILKIES